MFCSNEHYMSISHIPLIANMVHRRHLPKKGAPQAPVNKPSPPEGWLEPGWGRPMSSEGCQYWSREAYARPPRHPHQAASTDYRLQRRDTLDQIRAVYNTAGRSVPHLLDWWCWATPQRCYQRYLLRALPNEREWHRAFLRFVRTQDRSPDATDIYIMPQPQSVFSLKTATLVSGDKRSSEAKC